MRNAKDKNQEDEPSMTAVLYYLLVTLIYAVSREGRLDADAPESDDLNSKSDHSDQATYLTDNETLQALRELLTQEDPITRDLVRSSYGQNILSLQNHCQWYRELHKAIRKAKGRGSGEQSPKPHNTCSVTSIPFYSATAFQTVKQLARSLFGLKCEHVLSDLLSLSIRPSMANIFTVLLKIRILVCEHSSHILSEEQTLQTTMSEQESADQKETRAKNDKEGTTVSLGFDCNCMRDLNSWLYPEQQIPLDIFTKAIFEVAGLKVIGEESVEEKFDMIFHLASAVRLQFSRYKPYESGACTLWYVSPSESWSLEKAKSRFDACMRTLNQNQDHIRIFSVRIISTSGKAREDQFFQSHGITFYIFIECLRLRGMVSLKSFVSGVPLENKCHMLSGFSRDKKRRVMSHGEVLPAEERYEQLYARRHNITVVHFVKPCKFSSGIWRLSNERIVTVGLDEWKSVTEIAEEKHKKLLSTCNYGSYLPDKNAITGLDVLVSDIYGPICHHMDDDNTVSLHVFVKTDSLSLGFKIDNLDQALENAGFESKSMRLGTLSVLLNSVRCFKYENFKQHLVDLFNSSPQKDTVKGRYREPSAVLDLFSFASRHRVSDKVCLKILSSGEYVLSFLADGQCGVEDRCRRSILFYRVRKISPEFASFIKLFGPEEIILEDTLLTDSILQDVLSGESSYLMNNLKIVRVYVSTAGSHGASHLLKGGNSRSDYQHIKGLISYLKEKDVTVFLNGIRQEY